MANLIDTIAMMVSEDYRERFKAEYWQLKIRYYKLYKMIESWDNGCLEFTPDCPRRLYDLQLSSMEEYIAVLEARAKIEGIELEVV